MKAQQHIETDQVQEVASLLVPLSDKLLLMPNVTVAEIVPLGELEQDDAAPDWLLGRMTWRELSVPLMSLEVLNGHEAPEVSRSARVAVLNTTGLSDELGFIAILTQGLPRLARVIPSEISEREDLTPDTYDEMVVSWSGETAVIPAVAQLEQTYLNYLLGDV
ncbi:chemotaxis protein CheW [Gilvimarinus chinensis]|uniref:chemotaxis protein CheW n=1 Tax=Gilvimarinus chinensis TaxID=396005 RepID=UPI00037FDB61|nr:chemotaxis protein CheW [Gilvimarinus chinensis]